MRTTIHVFLCSEHAAIGVPKQHTCTRNGRVLGVAVLCACGWRVLENVFFRAVCLVFTARTCSVSNLCTCKRPVFGVAVLCACGWRVLENVSFSCRLHCVVARSVATSLVVAALFSVPGRAVFHTRVCAKGRVIRGGPCVWYSACCAQNTHITGTAHCAVSVFVLWRLTLYNCRQTTPPRCPLFRRLCVVVDWMKVISGPKSRIQ